MEQEKEIHKDGAKFYVVFRKLSDGSRYVWEADYRSGQTTQEVLDAFLETNFGKLKDCYEITDWYIN